jgi:hypothetical protein
MKIKYTIFFVLLVLVLIASEYIFLSELSSHQRLLILMLTSLIAIISIVAIFICYRRLSQL